MVIRFTFTRPDAKLPDFQYLGQLDVADNATEYECQEKAREFVAAFGGTVVSVDSITELRNENAVASTFDALTGVAGGSWKTGETILAIGKVIAMPLITDSPDNEDDWNQLVGDAAALLVKHGYGFDVAHPAYVEFI